LKKAENKKTKFIRSSSACSLASFSLLLSLAFLVPPFYFGCLVQFFNLLYFQQLQFFN
jgi:hypothetical protein